MRSQQIVKVTFWPNLCAAAVVLVLASGTGCAVRHTPAVANPPSGAHGEYLDLQPGWRLRVVQGNPKFSPVAEQGNQVTLRTADDFSHEVSYYEVRPYRRGVRIRFTSAQVFRNGEPTNVKRKTAELIRLPSHTNFVRLLYLVRASQSDHDMAVLAADSPDRLTQLTASVRADSTACRPGDRMTCQWIPNGAAVRAERRQPGSDVWSSVR